MPFESLNASPKTDAVYLDLLRTAPAASSRDPPKAALYKNLTLKEQNVAKVVKSAVTHLHFHPREDQLLIAAGDKVRQQLVSESCQECKVTLDELVNVTFVCTPRSSKLEPGRYM